MKKGMFCLALCFASTLLMGQDYSASKLGQNKDLIRLN